MKLGSESYYPSAIFDLFLPRIRDTGRANRLLFRLPVRWILTTNYDWVLNYASPSGTATFTWREAKQARAYLRSRTGPSPLLKLHGCASRPDTLILTRTEYLELKRQEEYLALTKEVFTIHSVLFLGYGMNDPLDLDFAISAANLAGAAQSEKFALVPVGRVAILRDKAPNINFLTYQGHDDLPKLIALFVRESTRLNGEREIPEICKLWPLPAVTVRLSSLSFILPVRELPYECSPGESRPPHVCAWPTPIRQFASGVSGAGFRSGSLRRCKDFARAS